MAQAEGARGRIEEHGLSAVVELAKYRSKGLLTMAREFFVMVSRGQVIGFKIQMWLKDGSRKTRSAGNTQGGENEECACAGNCSRRVRV